MTNCPIHTRFRHPSTCRKCAADTSNTIPLAPMELARMELARKAIDLARKAAEAKRQLTLPLAELQPPPPPPKVRVAAEPSPTTKGRSGRGWQRAKAASPGGRRTAALLLVALLCGLLLATPAGAVNAWGVTETAVWSTVIGVLIGFALFMWAWSATFNEAERKLGREPTWGELVFVGLVCVMAPPASLGAVLAYVWWIMPQRAPGRSPAPTDAKPATGARTP